MSSLAQARSQTTTKRWREGRRAAMASRARVMRLPGATRGPPACTRACGLHPSTSVSPVPVTRVLTPSPLPSSKSKPTARTARWRLLLRLPLRRSASRAERQSTRSSSRAPSRLSSSPVKLPTRLEKPARPRPSRPRDPRHPLARHRPLSATTGPRSRRSSRPLPRRSWVSLARAARRQLLRRRRPTGQSRPQLLDMPPRRK